MKSVLSPTLFLFVIDEAEGPEGVQWGLISFLKYLDYSHDICLLPHRIIDVDQMVLDLERKSGNVGLKTNNTTKISVLSFMVHYTFLIDINEQSIVLYLGNFVSGDGGTELTVARHIKKH